MIAPPFTPAQATRLYAAMPLAVKQEFRDFTAFYCVLQWFEGVHNIGAIPAALPSPAWCASVDAELADTAEADALALSKIEITVDFKQATELLQMFAGEPGEVTLTMGDGHSGKGLYAYYSEMPEEGAEYFGVSDYEAVPINEPSRSDGERPAYPVGEVVGPCVCGSWPGGECLKCEWRPATPLPAAAVAEGTDAQHTAGPWWVTDSGVRDRGGYICHTNPAQRYEGQDERFAQESAERAANKLLIAAAPELLSALLRCRFDSLNMTLADMEFCRAAVNKATGAAS